MGKNNPDTINDTLLCLQTGVPPRGSTQQLIETETDPQPNIRWSSGNLVEELWERSADPKRTETPQEDQQGQLTQTLGAPRD